MDVPQSQPRASLADSAARWAAVILMLVALVTLSFGLGFLVNELRQDDESSTVTNPASDSEDGIGAAIIDEIYTLLSENYVDKELLDPDAIRNAAIEGVLTTLNDPHTAFLSADYLDDPQFDFKSSYEGIGASVNGEAGQVSIVAPYRDSPAEKAGIRSGDLILEVDGSPIDGMDATEVARLVRGPSGTEVTLTVLHSNGQTETVTIVRGEIPEQSVFTEPLLEVIPGESGTKLVDRDGTEVTDIAYINLSQFQDNSHEALVTALEAVDGGDYSGLILDLRGNPGGLLTTTLQIANEFLDGGTIMIEQDADGNEQTWTAESGGLATEIPMVVLQDAGSASASEVLAAALQDHDRATVIGTRSLGKGTVNREFPLQSCGEDECGSIYISIGRWLTPNGEQIEGIGVVPDIEVPMTSDEYIESGDLQIFRAIEFLRGQ